MAAQRSDRRTRSGWKVTDGTHTMPTGDAAARTIHVTADNSNLAVTQSGTWTVQQGGAPWSVSASGNFNNASVSATGSAVPSSATYIGLRGSSDNLLGGRICDKHIIKNAFATSGSTQIIAAPGASKVTLVCAFAVNGASTTLNTVKLQYGTKVTTDCDTGATDMSIAVPIQAAASQAPIGMVVYPGANIYWDEDGNTNQQVCANLSAAQSVNLEVWYSTTNANTN